MNGDTKGCGWPNDTTRVPGPTRKQTQSVAGYDAPVQQERGVCLELTTPKKLKNVLNKEQRVKTQKLKENGMILL